MHKRLINSPKPKAGQGRADSKPAKHRTKHPRQFGGPQRDGVPRCMLAQLVRLLAGKMGVDLDRSGNFNRPADGFSRQTCRTHGSNQMNESRPERRGRRLDAGSGIPAVSGNRTSGRLYGESKVKDMTRLQQIGAATKYPRSWLEWCRMWTQFDLADHQRKWKPFRKGDQKAVGQEKKAGRQS